jgi:hypothetical protein
MSVCVYSVCVALCVDRGLATDLSPVQGALPTVYNANNNNNNNSSLADSDHGVCFF